jgi:hypothetical protein
MYAMAFSFLLDAGFLDQIVERSNWIDSNSITLKDPLQNRI